MDDDRDRVLGSPFVVRAARWGVVAWATIGVLVLAAAFFRFLIYPIRVIFPPLVVAMVAVYLLNPIVSRLERRGVGRVWGALLVYLVFSVAVGTAAYFLVPVVAQQVSALVLQAPEILDRLTAGLRDLLGRVGFNIGQAAPESEGLIDFLGRLVSFTRGLLDLALIFVLGPILGFYLLVDLPKIKRALRALIPTRRRREVEQVFERIGNAIGGFFRGQLLVALFVGIASSVGLLIVGLPFWAVVGMVSGLFNLIPLVGPFIGGGVAAVVAFTTDASGGLLSLAPGWPLAFGSAVALLIVQQIDNHILSPNIVGRTVRLHPVTVMLGLLAGGTLLGLWGMLLAVPTLASVKILILHAWDTRMTWPPPSERGGTEGERVATATRVVVGATAASEGRPPADSEKGPETHPGAAPETAPRSGVVPTGAPPGGSGRRSWLQGLRRLFRAEKEAEPPQPVGERRRR